MQKSTVMPRVWQLPQLGAKLLFLSRSQWWNRAAIRAYQERRLVDILRYAVTNVPYYANLGIRTKDISTGADLPRFPLLTKRDIQSHGDKLRSKQFNENQLMSSVTSGSTGEPTSTWFDPDAWLLCKFALKFRRTLLAGWPIGQRLFVFSDATIPAGDVAEPKKFDRIAYSELHVPLLVKEKEQYQLLSEFSPSLIYGPPSVVKSLCDYARENRLTLPHVKAVFLSSELISDDVRSTIEQMFSTKVIGIYGSTEFKEVAWQCKDGRYHTNFESVYLENLQDPADAGENRLLITTLVNKAMPLIRFDIGDYATLHEGQCSCGRESPYLDGIVGRQAEFLELRGGRRISPYLLTTNIETVAGIRQYQIVQRSDQSVELRVAFFPDAGAIAEKTRLLHDKMDLLIGEESDFVVSIVENIARPRAEKFKIVTKEP